MSSEINNQVFFDDFFYCVNIQNTKWIDVALITSSLVFFIIGLLCTSGVFNYMGTTNAIYLSYGVYAAATCCLLAKIIKLFCMHREAICSGIRLLRNPNCGLSNCEIEHLKMKVEVYKRNHPSVYNLEEKCNTILQTIDNADFRQNPVDFMLSWRDDYRVLPYELFVRRNEEDLLHTEYTTRADHFIYTFFVEEIRKIRELPDKHSDWYGVNK